MPSLNRTVILLLVYSYASTLESPDKFLYGVMCFDSWLISCQPDESGTAHCNPITKYVNK